MTIGHIFGRKGTGVSVTERVFTGRYIKQNVPEVKAVTIPAVH